MAPTLSEEAAINGDLPSLLPLSTMPASLGALVADLNRIGGRDEILASMYRHLAHWPAYLALTHVLLAPFAADDRLEPLIDNVLNDGRARARALVGELATPDVQLDAHTQASVHAALRRFLLGPISKMTAIVPLITRAMP